MPATTKNHTKKRSAVSDEEKVKKTPLHTFFMPIFLLYNFASTLTCFFKKTKQYYLCYAQRIHLVCEQTQ